MGFLVYLFFTLKESEAILLGVEENASACGPPLLTGCVFLSLQLKLSEAFLPHLSKCVGE